jgi:hypothetical protein
MGCSTDAACACATVPGYPNLCVKKPACSCLQSCQPDNTCAQPDTLCVYDSRCGGQALCYPISHLTTDACPYLYLQGNDQVKRQKRRARKAIAKKNTA